MDDSFPHVKLSLIFKKVHTKIFLKKLQEQKLFLFVFSGM